MDSNSHDSSHFCIWSPTRSYSPLSPQYPSSLRTYWAPYTHTPMHLWIDPPEYRGKPLWSKACPELSLGHSLHRSWHIARSCRWLLPVFPSTVKERGLLWSGLRYTAYFSDFGGSRLRISFLGYRCRGSIRSFLRGISRLKKCWVFWGLFFGRHSTSHSRGQR